MAIAALTDPTPAGASAMAARPAARPVFESPMSARTDDGPPPVPEAEMSFWDFVDIINPLQHIPVVGTVYRELTGDTITGASRVMGGILFGGVVGGVAAVANAVMEEGTGKDMGGQMLAALGLDGDEPAPPGTTAVTDADSKRDKVAPAAAAVVADTAPVIAPAVPPALQAAAPAAQAAAATPAPSASAAPAATTATTARRDPFTALPGEHRPSKMPARDTILANTAQAKLAVRAQPGVGVAALPTAPAAAPPATDAKASAATAAPSAATAPNGMPQPVPPEMLSDVMMRNLAKYEAARKAAQAHGTSAGVRVSG